MNINKAIIMGNLTRDPEIKSLPSGLKVASLALATNRSYKDQDGNKKESVEYHNAVAFGRLAEVIGQYAKKGSSLYIEGRIQTRSWDAQDGSKRYRTEIVVENFQFGPRAGGVGMGQSAPSAPAEDNQDMGNDAMEGIDAIEYPEEDNNLEDIPF
ncbi:single-stranded DNA-binding protein [Candidatus Nomurabacteria bacterium]|nr:single-stranded DNA-binding protein [Candidatus Nomurabacteria bacterium]USN94589.1 MAG: single-stranded DNA-binding protein [Candidatus Nomurabacteria bacterium]